MRVDGGTRVLVLCVCARARGSVAYCPNTITPATQAGRGDVALIVAQGRTPPSYVYMVEQGATTLWETWFSTRYAPGASPSQPSPRLGVPSWNHIMFGSISEWYFKHLAGIQQETTSRGWERIVFRPRVWIQARNASICGNLSSAHATVLTSRGTVGAAWVCGHGPEPTPTPPGVPPASPNSLCPAGGEMLGGNVVEEWNAGRTAEVGSMALACSDGKTMQVSAAMGGHLVRDLAFCGSFWSLKIAHAWPGTSRSSPVNGRLGLAWCGMGAMGHGPGWLRVVLRKEIIVGHRPVVMCRVVGSRVRLVRGARGELHGRVHARQRLRRQGRGGHGGRGLRWQERVHVDGVEQGVWRPVQHAHQVPCRCHPWVRTMPVVLEKMVLFDGMCVCVCACVRARACVCVQ